MAAWAEILSCCGSSSTMFLGSTWKGLEEANRSHVVSSNIPSNNLHNPINVSYGKNSKHCLNPASPVRGFAVLLRFIYCNSKVNFLYWQLVRERSHRGLCHFTEPKVTKQWNGHFHCFLTFYRHEINPKNKTNQIAKCIPISEIYRAEIPTLFVLFKL